MPQSRGKRRPKRDEDSEKKVIQGFVRAAADVFRERIEEYERHHSGDHEVELSLRVIDKRIGDQDPRVISVLLQLHPDVFVGLYHYMLGRATLAMFQFSDLVRALSPELYRLVENTLDLERRRTCIELFLREVAPPGTSSRINTTLYTLPGEDSIQIVSVFPIHQAIVNYAVSEVLGTGGWSKLKYTLINLEMLRQMTFPDITRATMTSLYNECVEAGLAKHAGRENIDERVLERISEETAPKNISLLFEKAATSATYFGMIRRPRDSALEMFGANPKKSNKH